MAERTTTAPRGWHVAGSHRSAYVAGVDPGVMCAGRPAGYLASNRRKVEGFGTLMQAFSPARYRGKRVRLAGHLKSEKLAGWAGLWLRIDPPGRREQPRSQFDGPEQPLAFDNMEDRPIRGSTGWTACEVVLDVDPMAANISFGVLLVGTGTVWIDGLVFEEVDETVAVTAVSRVDVPRNLAFDE